MWWTTESLAVTPVGLRLDGVELVQLAREQGTPCFVYSARRIRHNLDAIREAMPARSLIQYAMKANRSHRVLDVIREYGGVGIDACSPGEVALALEAGFRPAEISFNASMLSDRDLDAVVASGVPVILDTFSALRRYRARVPRGTPIGLRFDPDVRAGYTSHLAYGRAKFGFDLADFADVLHAASDFEVVGLHIHLGWGLREEAAGAVDLAFARLASLARRVPSLVWVNVGGGLGARYRGADRPLSLSRWGRALHEHLAPLGVAVVCEPGTAVVSDAGVLLVQVNTVERRRGVTWVGVDAGHAVDPCPVFYGIPIEVVHASCPAEPVAGRYRVVGHINEASDVWATDVELPEVGEGDILAFLPAGAYAASMASNHCLRGSYAEVLIDP